MCKYSTLRINTKCNCCNHVKRKRSSVNIFSSMNFLLFLVLVICQLPTLVYGEHSNSQGETEGIHIASWNWDHVGVFITVTAFIVLSGLAKVAFHHAYFLSSRLPESCLLILVGVCMGAAIYFGLEVTSEKEAEEDDPKHEKEHFTFPTFTPTLFFFALLPPIILESAYSLYDKAFFDNLPTILIMAVIGTAFNFLAIGGLLYVVFLSGMMGEIPNTFTSNNETNHDKHGFGSSETKDEMYDLGSNEVLLFSSLISAVDPVAVLAIFQEVGVNPDLYFLLFGESLLNDGVAVVIYNMMNTFAEMSHNGIAIPVTQVLLGLCSFFTIALGGLLIGVIYGLITALVTKTTTEVRVCEPLAIFGIAYLSYATAELFHWSGIISLIGCGIVQAHYSFKNISKKSYTTVKYFIKMLSSTSDCIIFLFLGIALVKESHYWHTGFVVWTLAFCLVCRFIGVYVLTWIVNRKRVRQINVQEQFITAYGGLRGAVGFSLVEMIDSSTVPPKQMFVTTTLAVVMFTVFFQGATIKFLVNLLDIDKAKSDTKLISEEVNENVMEHILAGIEIISGRARGSHYLNQVMERLDDRYFMKWFTNNANYSSLTRVYEDLSVADHLCNLYGPTVISEDVKNNIVIRHVPENEEDVFAQNSNIHDGLESHSSDHADFGDEDGGISSAQLTVPVIPPRRDLKPHSISHSISRPLNSLFKSSTGESNRGSFSGSFVGGPSSPYLASTSSPYTPSTRGQRSFNFVLDPSPPPLMTRKQSRDEVAMVRHALKQNAYSRYHHKHNPNLIGDEEQELDAHLRKRRINARKISQHILTYEGSKLPNSISVSPTSSRKFSTNVPPKSTEDNMSEKLLYENINVIENRKDNESGNNGNEEVRGPLKVPQSQEILFDRVGLINSIPANQRQAVSAILRQRQAQRIRSKSMVHHNLNLERPGVSTETNIKNYSNQNEDSNKTQIKGPRRKITPAPINLPPNRIIHGYSKVSILEEEEEPSTNIENNENDKEKDLHVRL